MFDQHPLDAGSIIAHTHQQKAHHKVFVMQVLGASDACVMRGEPLADAGCRLPDIDGRGCRSSQFATAVAVERNVSQVIESINAGALWKGALELPQWQPFKKVSSQRFQRYLLSLGMLARFCCEDVLYFECGC